MLQLRSTSDGLASNVSWLRENLADAPDVWPRQPFWDLVAGLPRYRAIKEPRRRLAAVHVDLGSMFFVTE